MIDASYTYNDMVGRTFGTIGLEWTGKDPKVPVYFEGFGGGYDFTETMGMKMAAGRSFSRQYSNDSANIILNETAIAAMHLTDPVGKTIRLFGQPRQIVGVVKDFHFESLHEPVRPSYLILANGSPWFKIMVRIGAEHQEATLDRIRKLYEEYNPGFPWDFNFLDAAYQKQYATESRASVLSGYFAGLAILISCLGLFGLATFTAQRRQKEIGIRKVVGASVGGIVTLFSMDFLKLVLLAVLIAFPLSWWVMNRWLDSFSYRIHIGAGIFFLAGISVVSITFLTIGYQAIRAAVANPVKSLRSE